MSAVGDTVISIHIKEEHRGEVGEADVTVFVDGMQVYNKHQKSEAVQAIRELEHAKFALTQLQVERLAHTIKTTTKKAKPAAKSHRGKKR